jgi:uncharacterized membrane protein YphA (DoxX/SURF4 family)
MILDLVNRAGKGVEDWLMDPIDARVYACVRIAYGLLCFSVILETWPVADALFSDVGMSWHRPDLLPYLPVKYIRSPGAVKAFMAFSALASLTMTFGLLTRLSAFALYFWNFSYCAIGYPAEAGYDGIARIVGFVLLWAPAIRTWSLDERLFGPGEAELPRYTLRLMQVQLTIIYVATVWLKAPDNYWRSGELMAYFLMSMYARVPTWHWAELGRTSVLMSWFTLIAETTIPFCLFSPRFRRLGYFMGFALHAGIALTSTIFMFSLAMVPLYMAFLTKQDIDDSLALVARFRKQPKLATASASATVPMTASANEQKEAAKAEPIKSDEAKTEPAKAKSEPPKGDGGGKAKGKKASAKSA